MRAHSAMSPARSTSNGDHCESSQRRYSVWGSFSWTSSLTRVGPSGGAAALGLGAACAGPVLLAATRLPAGCALGDRQSPRASVGGVGVSDEDLPGRALRVAHPDLVLPRVAAGRVHLV